ncbi:MAG: phosphoglycolate phosphatase [Hydrogenophilaceae bacterium]
MIRAVLFDLDGTLVDTAPDLGYTINQMRDRRGQSPLPANALRARASHGSQALIELGFGVTQSDAGFPELRHEFLEIYEAHLADQSRLFPGMDRLLSTFESRGIVWGVVTNKPARLTEPLLERLGLSNKVACVVSGDTCAHAKPAPEPMLHACRSVALEPQQCLYVGDAERDVQAARAAGMPVLVALYGYLAETDHPDEWGGDGYINQPLDLLDYPGLAP